MTTAKALGGGLPIGALVTGRAPGRRAAPRATTARPSRAARWSRAAALVALELTDDEELLARVRELGAAARRGPRAAAARARGARARADARVRAGRRRARGRAPRAAEQRLLVNATGPTTLRLLPPLIVSDERGRGGRSRGWRALAA